MAGGQAVKIKGADETIAQVDRMSGGLVIEDTFHERIHAGELYMASHSDASLAGASTLVLFVKVADDYPIHLRVRASCGADATLDIHEGPTSSADGTSVPVFNVNRASSNTSTTTVFHTPTTSNLGTQLVTISIPNKWGSSAGLPEEIILATETNYIMVLTNRGSVASASILLDFYPN